MYMYTYLKSNKGRNNIISGTQWCGPGNNAKNDSHLGSLKLVDACCRDHDNCNVSMNAMEYKYGIFNFGLWTK